MSIGNSVFGKPAKITVNTFAGKTGIINIEREIEMSGSTHSKGVLILSGYLDLYIRTDNSSISSSDMQAILDTDTTVDKPGLF